MIFGEDAKQIISIWDFWSEKVPHWRSCFLLLLLLLLLCLLAKIKWRSCFRWAFRECRQKWKICTGRRSHLSKEPEAYLSFYHLLWEQINSLTWLGNRWKWHMWRWRQWNKIPIWHKSGGNYRIFWYVQRIHY